MSQVSVHFSPTPREYTGRELRSHFALHAFGIQGDAAVAFVGPCSVDLEHMVDLEDVLAGDSISSPLMLHAIVEHFGLELREGVLRQRLLGRLAADLLQEKGVAAVRVRGDDLYVAERKASVSIATRSPVSVLIHLGINVETAGTPLPTWGLAEAGVRPEDFAAELLHSYAAEIDDIHRATCKVRGVS